jgi:hypothetical protein
MVFVHNNGSAWSKFSSDPAEAETTLSDYRRVDAVLWPFVWRSTTTSPTGNATTVYTHVEINRPLSATLFDRLR